ncbi:MAG: 16S rRNA (cytosine(1402)-N(4))-methyltransferase RsmH [Nitrospirae bacterium]|nr:MAG: 16S rRNA (cytosine(1402)-N(4))-methyltransferase RsmH [Nitrospirota bacterium]
MMFHQPVMIEETLGMLNVKQNGTYVDATVGLGGHAYGILSRLGGDGRIVGMDRDDNALKIAFERLGNKRVHLAKGSFSSMDRILASFGVMEFDGVVFDLGLSMMQLKDLGRGFSFNSTERLDMRMDQEQSLSAWDVVNRYQEKALEKILREYGEERLALKIAKAVVSKRKQAAIDTCAELAETVSAVYGYRGKIHPATRTFQALRIEVNRELDELGKGLSAAASGLRNGGRVCVISYHSLEDRIVKNFIRDGAKSGVLRNLTKKPLTPRLEEIKKNPASRSAKLRGAEKI